MEDDDIFCFFLNFIIFHPEDGQTERHTYRPPDTQTDNQTHIQTTRYTDRHRDTHTDNQIHR